MPKDISWLNAHRRRPSGQLRSTSDAHSESQSPLHSSQNSKAITTPRPPPRSSSMLASLSSSAAKTRASFARPSLIQRHQSQPSVIENKQPADSGNLFYAYAQKSTDEQSSHLLTFASAAIAREWWLLVQVHFPKISRPSLQTFKYVDDELLATVWRHAAFEHIRSKWMFIALPPQTVSGDNMGGLIPVQDDCGNLLGGSMPSSPDRRGKIDVRRSLSSIRDENGFDETIVPDEDGTKGDDVPNDKGLTDRELQDRKHSLPNNPNTDLSQILVELNGIQALMAQQIARRDQSRRQSGSQLSTSTATDFTPLIERIDILQEVMVANLVTIRKLLERNETRSDKSPLESASNHQNVKSADINSLDRNLEKINSAIHTLHLQQSNPHLNESTNGQIQLGEKLDQVNEHLSILREWAEFDSAHLQDLLTLHQTALDTTTLRSSSTNDSKVNTRSSSQQVTQRKSVSKNTDELASQQSLGTGDVKFLVSALTSHLSQIQAVTEKTAEQISTLREFHAASARQKYDINCYLQGVIKIWQQQQTQQRQQQQNHVNQQRKDQKEQKQIQAESPKQQVEALSHQTKKTSETNPHFQLQRLERGLEATTSQVRELMSGQRELVDVMRLLAESLKVSNKMQCDHVVVPPPRKMSRKVVGFVYDVKDGAI